MNAINEAILHSPLFTGEAEMYFYMNKEMECKWPFMECKLPFTFYLNNKFQKYYFHTKIVYYLSFLDSNDESKKCERTKSIWAGDYL